MTTIHAPTSTTAAVTQAQLSSAAPKKDRAKTKAEFAEKFNEVLGQTMYGTILKEFRKTSHKTPYFNGGRTEEVFGQQLDQVLAEKMAHRDAGKIGRLSALTTLPRR
jgi:peptidoglycan hydrolase FlgJ